MAEITAKPVRISECDDKYVLLNVPGGERTTLLSGAEVPEFATEDEAYKWAVDNNFDVEDTPIAAGDCETHQDELATKNDAAKKAEANAECAKDSKVLADAHLHDLEKFAAKRRAERLERAVGKLSDEELDAEIGRRRK